MNRLLTAVTTAPIFALAALLAAAPGAATSAESGVYKMDETHASITWSVQHLGLSNYTARFEDFDIRLTLDVDDVSKSSVTATIDPTSVSTGFPGEKDFDAEISNDPGFFDAGKYPEVAFVSTAIERTGDNTARITGDLTMIGVTREITLEATLLGTLDSHPLLRGRPAVGFEATALLDRTDFGMTAFSNALSDGGPAIVSPQVRVTINAEFTKAE